MNSKSLVLELSSLLQTTHLNLHQLHQIHARIIYLGAHQNDLIATRLIGRYPFHIALRVFNFLNSPNIYPFNAIIRVLAHQNVAQTSLAFSFFKKLKKQSFFPNDFTFSFLLKACIHCRDALYVKQVHTHVVKVGFMCDVGVCNGVLGCYIKGCKDFVDARKVFDEIPERSNVVSWTCLIDGYAKNGFVEKALDLFVVMAKEMVIPGNDTMVSVLSACAKVNVSGVGEWIRVFMDCAKGNECGSLIKDFVNMVLVYLYGKCGKVDESREVFDRIGDHGKRSVVAWNAMIGAYVQNGCALEGLSLFKEIIDYPYVSPNHVTMVGILSACSQIGDLDLGIWVHEYIKSQRREDVLRSNSFLATAMMDMYCKCGDLSRAEEVFRALVSKDVISYGVMIMGLALNGKGNEALKLYYEMLGCGLRPNGGTFLGVLCACCHSGLLDIGREIFLVMKENFAVQPQLEHYACYIDLLARAGKIEEALDVTKSMPFKPNNFVWGALLGGCLLHFRRKLTQDISRKLIEVDPRNSAGYVMLSNALARDHQWVEVSGLRQSMKEKGVRKYRGSSWISIDGIVHEFLSGPCSHLEVSSINGMLGLLLKEMKLPRCHIMHCLE